MNRGGFDRSAVTEDEDLCILSVFGDYLVSEFRDAFHVLTVSLAAGEAEIGTDIGIEDPRKLVFQLLPRVAFAVAERLLTQFGIRLNVIVGSQFQ